MQKHVRRVFLSLVLTMLGLLGLHPQAAVRADAAWQVIFNGVPSQLAIQEVETGKVVPISFTVPPEGQRHLYSVWVENDPLTSQVKVTRVKKQAPVRGPGDCRFCNGSRRCQDCYPAGSKVNTAGLPCVGCNASGSCSQCDGSGVCYTCDGKGFLTGCPDCSKVVASK